MKNGDGIAVLEERRSPPSMLDRSRILHALSSLGREAIRNGASVRVLIVGGAAMCLRFGSRESTRDIDAVFLEPSEAEAVRRLVKDVAASLDLPDDWLNDGAKGYIRPPVVGTILLEAPGIEAIMPSLEQMLAMKLSAWRDDVDIEDASTLTRALREQGREKEETWSTLEGYLVPGRETKARYAFDEVWES